MTLALLATPAWAGTSRVSKSGHGCKVTASVNWNSSANRYTYSGKAGCSSRRSMKLWCFPVHRHSFSWHSHTGDIIQNGPRTTTSLGVGPATKRGTNGDRYKINCKLEVPRGRVVVETGQFNL
ncbi:hypothetical protein GCM10022224_042260 [Nonomuraea antimicrobica]|uniref:Uncharacterized protein n=1 Tax=Nonomuraea antimicrobica TaxID=561173 RepID=A0ABP7BZZ9_9ACTN